jgi:hypothetical protein
MRSSMSPVWRSKHRVARGVDRPERAGCRKAGPKLADDVVEGLVDELSEVTLRPVASFRDAFEGGHPRDEGVVVTVSPIRDQNGPAKVSANVFAGPGNASGSQLVAGLRNGEWGVIRVIGTWIT